MLHVSESQSSLWFYTAAQSYCTWSFTLKPICWSHVSHLRSHLFNYSAMYASWNQLPDCQHFKQGPGDLSLGNSTLHPKEQIFIFFFNPSVYSTPHFLNAGTGDNIIISPLQPIANGPTQRFPTQIWNDSFYDILKPFRVDDLQSFIPL